MRVLRAKVTPRLLRRKDNNEPKTPKKSPLGTRLADRSSVHALADFVLPTFHKYQEDTELCYILAPITALSYMVYLKKLHFDSVPPMVQDFMYSMTNLPIYKEIGFKDVRENLKTFDDEYNIINDANEEKEERKKDILDGGLVTISLKVLLSDKGREDSSATFEKKLEAVATPAPTSELPIEFSKLKHYSPDSPNLNSTIKLKSLYENKEFLEIDKKWHACIVGIKEPEHYICVVKENEDKLMWFDTLQKKEYDPLKTQGWDVDELVYIVEAEVDEK